MITLTLNNNKKIKVNEAYYQDRVTRDTGHKYRILRFYCPTDDTWYDEDMVQERNIDELIKPILSA